MVKQVKLKTSLQQKIVRSIELIRKAEKLALDYDPNGFYLAFSGGKDSQVIYHLCELAGVKFVPHMNLTSVDPPQVLKFVRKYYDDVIRHRPEKSIYKIIPEKKTLPTRKIRWCCAVLKEQSGAGTVTILGVRRAESVRRSKRNEMEISDRKFSGTIDQFSERQETEVACIKGKDKIMLNPILDWADSDVWDFLNFYNIPHCELYDMGYKRIGCIMCPMASKSNLIRDRKNFPGVERAYKRAIAELMESNPNYAIKFREHRTPDVIFDWWVSKKNIDAYIAENFTQQKINFIENN